MNTHKKLLPVIVSFFMLSPGFLHVANAQDSKQSKKATMNAHIKSLVQEKDFTFVAQSVSPLGGSMRQLTSNYDLQVSGDTTVSNLPYFGRAYSAPINPGEGGIHFTSTKFDIKADARKKGGWDVLIKPSDANDIQQLFLTISESGSATLQVTSTNRQPISFNGYIKDRQTNK